QGADIVLSINGQPVAWVQDETQSEGRLELGVSTNERGRIEGHFRDFVVSAPGPIERPTAQPRPGPAAPAPGAPAPAAPPFTLIPRPELALTARDLPPGYEEVVSTVDVAGRPAEVRRLQRAPGGIGPALISSVTFEVQGELSDEALLLNARAFAAGLSRGSGPN